MNVIFAFCLLAVPALLVLPLVTAHLRPTNWFIRWGTSFIVGGALSVGGCYVLASELKNATFHPLRQALGIEASVAAVFFAIYWRCHAQEMLNWGRSIKTAWLTDRTGLIFEIVFLAAFISVAICFFTKYLALRNGIIFITPVYWDAAIHLPMIQNLAWSGTFPAETEYLSGYPLTTHFFTDLYMALFVVLGLHVVDALNTVSILAAALIAILMIGIGKHFLSSRLTGILACLLTFLGAGTVGLSEELKPFFPWLGAPLGLPKDYDVHPFLFGHRFLPSLGFSAHFLNVFFLIEERQLLFAVAIQLSALILLSIPRKPDASLASFVLGLFLGCLMLWHFQLTILNGAILGLSWVLIRRNKAAFFTLVGYTLAAGAIAWSLRERVAQVPEVAGTLGGFPRFNFLFYRPKAATFDFYRWTLYWWQEVGFKALLATIGFILVYRAHKQFGKFLVLSTGVAFLLVNSVQVSPLDIHDNHKWLRYCLTGLDIGAASLVASLFASRQVRKIIAAVVLSGVLLAGGLIEFLPFWRVTPDVPYISESLPLVKVMQEHTRPTDVVLGRFTHYTWHAGRRTYVRLKDDHRTKKNYAQGIGVSLRKRRGIARQILRSPAQSRFCRLTRRHKVDVVLLQSKKDRKLIPKLAAIPQIKKLPGITIVLARECPSLAKGGKMDH